MVRPLMPPVSPECRGVRVRQHIAQAREYWSRWPAILSGGDLCHASEKGWGAVVQLTKAMATLRQWDHYDHVAIREIITTLIDENPQQAVEIARGLRAAESLHGNFYEVYMTPFLAQTALDDTRPLLEILWGLLPAEYTGGGSFA